MRPDAGEPDLLTAIDLAALRGQRSDPGAFARIIDRCFVWVARYASAELRSFDRWNVVLESIRSCLLDFRDPLIEQVALERRLLEALERGIRTTEAAARIRAESDRVVFLSTASPKIDRDFQALVVAVLAAAIREPIRAALDLLPEPTRDVLVEFYGLNQVGIPIYDVASLRFRNDKERSNARNRALWEFSAALERVLETAPEDHRVDPVILEQALHFVRGLTVSQVLALFADGERVA